MATQSTSIQKDGVKVTLSKKSGPGVLIGITELKSINGSVDFTGLQFDTPGDYVLLATSESGEFQPVEVNINVQKEEEVIPQESTRGEDSKEVSGNRPIIAQIDKPTLVLAPIQYKTTNSKTDNNEIVTGLGLTPFLWYNSYQISQTDIISLELYYEDMVPKAVATFRDSLGFMKKEGFPLDDTKFEIFLNSGSKSLKSIHMKFKLSNFVENRNSSYTITGTIDLKDFYKIKYQGYKGTSFDTLKKISNELGLGFNSNINTTNDTMNWVNDGKLPYLFVKDIISHSYISDTSYVLGYIDFYYCFNYVDIEKEWLRDISNDVGLSSTGVNNLNEENVKEKIEKLFLTNDPSLSSGPFYFSKYKLNNQSTSVSINKGQFMMSKVYDSIKKQFLIFNVDSQTSDGSKNIILKGAPGDPNDVKENFRTKYSGKMDTENVHKNYYYSETQNKVNLDNMVRISVDMELPNPNFNLYKFMKIQINFINQKNTPTNEDVVMQRLSGEWVIIDIGYRWSRGNFIQTVKAVRKELSKTDEELKNDNTQQKSEVNSQNNENPVTESNDIKSIATPPNSVYKVGEVYTVQNSKGSKFSLKIIEVMQDGKNVKASIKNL